MFAPQGPYGRSRLASQADLKALRQDVEAHPERYIRLLDGFAIYHDPKVGVIEMPAVPLPMGVTSPNALFVGCSGSEKTMRGILPAIVHAIQSGLGLVVINAKGVRQTRFIREVVRRAGRADELMLLAPRKPDRSMSWNPLEGCTDAACASTLATSLMRMSTSLGRATDWAERDGQDYLQHLILAVCTDLPPRQRTLYTIRKLLIEGDFCGIADRHPAFPGLRAFANYHQNGNNNAATIAGVLRGVTRFVDEVAAFLSGHEVSLSRFASEGGILILELDPQDVEPLSMVTSLLLSGLLAALQRQACNSPTGSLERKVLFAIDEFAAAGPVPGMANALHLCREMGFCFIAAIQSLAQLSVYGNAAKTILDGFQTHVVMPGLDRESADYYSVKSGTATIAVPAVLEVGSEEGSTVPTARSWSLAARPLLLPSDIASPAGHPHYGPPATLFLGDRRTPPFQAYLTPVYDVGQMQDILESVTDSSASDDRRNVPLLDPAFNLESLADKPSANWLTVDKNLFTDGKKLRPKMIEKHNAEAKLRVGWEAAGIEVRQWWEDVERTCGRGDHRLLRLYEELIVRNATITEYYNCYFGGVLKCSHQQVLCRMDALRIKSPLDPSHISAMSAELPPETGCNMDEPDPVEPDPVEPDPDETVLDEFGAGGNG
ncbi:MAG: type IV secretory system conjugative DNA transfer family protein [Phycisphaerales bacterium]|nr:type IV secretory system conjugative DNA transfer family protein [Phycisphaerales bacterium]